MQKRRAVVARDARQAPLAARHLNNSPARHAKAGGARGGRRRVVPGAPADGRPPGATPGRERERSSDSAPGELCAAQSRSARRPPATSAVTKPHNGGTGQRRELLKRRGESAARKERPPGNDNTRRGAVTQRNSRRPAEWNVDAAFFGVIIFIFVLINDR